jgi:hypothetical protein
MRIRYVGNAIEVKVGCIRPWINTLQEESDMSEVETADLENDFLAGDEWGTAEQDGPDLLMATGIDDVRDWLRKNYGSHERLPVLLDVADDEVMNFDDWLTLLGEEWLYFDNVGIHKDRLFDLVSEMVLDIETVIPQMMCPKERVAFDALPEQIKIYRGCGPRNMFGFSWSLDREIAAKFPFMRRYSTDQPRLLTATISKSRVAALKLERGEREVVVFDYQDEPSIHRTQEPLLTDPAGNLIDQSSGKFNG